ncbi:MAG: ribosome silencing factor [Prevotellaceae bacterium]|jgi:ribosome-associated protein|nr:ribosome silencing factor [Prevotellaceae bacterium]
MAKTVKKITGKKTAAKPLTKPSAAKKAPVAKKAVAKGKETLKKTASVKKVTRKIKKITSVDVIAQALLDKKAQNVVSLDLTPLDAAICDYFVIAHADSGTQVAALADNVEKEMRERMQEKPVRIQGKENAFWVIVDYGDVVVHIFQTAWRMFYRLEELWADAIQKNHSENAN